MLQIYVENDEPPWYNRKNINTGSGASGPGRTGTADGAAIRFYHIYGGLANMKKKCIAMLLAGGQGSRLGALTRKIAKPAVSFGGKYRIIDFSLSNCANSQIDTVGIMTQYRPQLLNTYIATGSAWDLDARDGGVSILPPYATSSALRWYQGTADAVYQNIDYIDHYDPDYVLILSGDHLYRMDYSKMLQEHEDNNADLTISTIRVPWEEASRFGILTTDDEGRILRFSEKPKEPDSNKASMGIYIFSWPLLRSALEEDHEDEKSAHDFGKNIIPKLLDGGKRLFAYDFVGYWKDVGTFTSYYEANMELLDPKPGFDLFSKDQDRILSNVSTHEPDYIGPEADIRNSMICPGCAVYGTVEHSVVGVDVLIGEGAVVRDSVVLPGVRIGENTRIEKCIVSEDVTLGAGLSLRNEDGSVLVIGEDCPADGERSEE